MCVCSYLCRYMCILVSVHIYICAGAHSSSYLCLLGCVAIVHTSSNLFTFMCVTGIYIYIHTYICMYMYICSCSCLCRCTHIFISEHIYVCGMCTYISMSVHVCAGIHASSYLCTFTCVTGVHVSPCLFVFMSVQVYTHLHICAIHVCGRCTSIFLSVHVHVCACISEFSCIWRLDSIVILKRCDA